MAVQGCQAGQQPPADRPSVTTTCEIQLDYIVDVADMRQAAGFASNIFVGVVEQDLGTRSDSATDFVVSAVHNLKGSYSGSIRIRQDGTRDCLANGEAILEPGKSYVFAVNDWPEGGANPLIVAYAITPGQLRAAETSDYQGPVADMADAVTHQIAPRGPS
jgi:hypothetical protein